jgi:hypothetical protein
VKHVYLEKQGIHTKFFEVKYWKVATWNAEDVDGRCQNEQARM